MVDGCQSSDGGNDVDRSVEDRPQNLNAKQAMYSSYNYYRILLAIDEMFDGVMTLRYEQYSTDCLFFPQKSVEVHRQKRSIVLYLHRPNFKTFIITYESGTQFRNSAFCSDVTDRAKSGRKFPAKMACWKRM
jgi:hypothetical protein